MMMRAAMLCILSFLSSPARADIIAGRGSYSALMVTVATPRQLVERLLPPGLFLAAQNLTASGTHPMILTFGNQSNVRPAAPFPELFDWTYFEFIHTIPFVQKCKGAAGRACHGPFLFSPKLYLNSIEPTVAGWMYGLPSTSCLLLSGRTAGCGLPDGPIVEASWTLSGAFRPPSSFAKFAPLARVMSTQPMIGVQRLTDTFECSRFIWGLDRPETVIAPAVGTARLHSKYGSPFERGAALPFRGIEAEQIGAFVIRTEWTMTPPLRATSPRHAYRRSHRRRPAAIAVIGGGLGHVCGVVRLRVRRLLHRCVHDGPPAGARRRAGATPPRALACALRSTAFT